MLKKFKLSALGLAAALLLSPNMALASDRDHRHHHRFSIRFGVGGDPWHPYYGYGPYPYPYGYYDRWGYWHPYPPY